MVAVPPRFFLARNVSSGLYLDINKVKEDDGTKIITWSRHGEFGYINQHFYEDTDTGTLRSRMNNKCITINPNDHRLEIQPYDAENPMQQWELGGGVIRHRLDRNYVLSISNKNMADPSFVEMSEFSGAEWQVWDFRYITVPVRQYFYIKSKLNGMVLDISSRDVEENATIIMWTKKNNCNSNQTWYEDADTGTIRSRMNDLCLAKSDHNDYLTMQKYQAGKANQQVELAGNVVRLRGDRNSVVEVADANSDKGARVQFQNFHTGANQLWEFDYMSQIQKKF